MKLKIALIEKSLPIAGFLSRALITDCSQLALVQIWDTFELSSLNDADCVIAILDLKDCGNGNLEVIRQIAQTKPVIIVSGSDHQRAAIDCFRVGVADFMPMVELVRGKFINRLQAAVRKWHEERKMDSRVNQRLCELLRQSETDSLTGLSNRHFFDRLIAQTPQPDRRKPLGLILVDVDNFKLINDRFGHSAGDKVLKDLADLIRAQLRAGDAAIRWGGEEFVALCGGASLAETWLWALRLRDEVERHVFYHESTPLTATISAGVMRLEDQSLGYSAIERADQALYLAKSTGRNRVCSDQMVKVEEALREVEQNTHLNPAGRWQMLIHLCVPILGESQYRHVSEHCRQVSKVAAVIAGEMKLPPEMVRRVELAGLLPDVGKLVVPEELLSMPRSLLEEEWQLMNFAIEEGQRIAKRLGADPATIECIRGRCGPLERRAPGKRGFGAQILAVADAIAAMSAEQPYRHARNPNLVQAELTRCAGTQFDPRVISRLNSLPVISLAA